MSEAESTAKSVRGDSFRELVRVMERLRGPGGCPWDQEQTHATLKPYFIEETHEALEAIDTGDDPGLVEELGDVLLQVVFHAELLRERGQFDVDDVVRAICEKLVRRHPHVFGELTVSDSGEVLRNWYEFKAAERKARKGDDASVLTGVPRTLPGLLRAQRLGEKAASVGFDWSDADSVLAKMEEEIAELRAALRTERGEGAGASMAGRARVEAELGDLLFAGAQLARRLGVDAEEGVRGTCERFTARFHHIEAAMRAEGRPVKGATMEELDARWEVAKKAVG